MKRFLALAAAAVMLGAMVSLASAAVCTSEGASFCQYSTGCYEMSSEYSGVGGVCDAGECTCEQVIAGCKKDGALYSGVTGLNAANDYGKGVKCADNGGTLVGTPPPELCGGYCKWTSGCEAISTDPAGSYGPAITTCEAAIANCDKDGARFDNSSCTGTQIGGNESCGGYCKWDSGCEEIKTDKNGDYGDVVATCTEAIAKCDKDGQRFETSSCTGTQVGGDESCGSYCYWDATDECVENKTDKGGNYHDEPITSCSEVVENCKQYGKMFSDKNCTVAIGGGDGVRYFGSKAVAPGLKVSYAKGRVSVNWNAGTKVSNGTVQLLNVKGVALSTAFIKGNSSKVSVKLGTVGVPAGMYFVQINAVGQNGKKIVTRSAVSIVK